MARSRRGQITGLNLQRIDGQRLSDLNVRTFVLYDESAAFAPELRSRVPDALIVLRLIQHSHWDRPELSAQRGADLCRQYPQVDLLCPANEQNYENGATMSQIAGWCDRFNDAWAVAGAPKRTVSPAISPGAPFSLSELQASWRRFDYIGVHAYATLQDLSFSAASGLLAAHRRVWPDKKHILTEFNVDKLEGETYRHAEGAAAVGLFLNQLAQAPWVEGAMWFLDDAHGNDQPYRLVRIQPLMDLFRHVGHEVDAGGGQPQPPGPGDPEIRAIEARYNMSHLDSDGVRLAELGPRPDPPIIEAWGPADMTVRVATKDDRNFNEGLGHAGLNFNHDAAYFPTQGQTGFFYAECGGARVYGLGWAFGFPDDTAPHRNVAVRFARASGPGPTPPPSQYTWSGAFAEWAAGHPEVGQPIGPIAYLPQSTEPWPCCAQVSATHVLVWNGNGAGQGVTAIRRAV